MKNMTEMTLQERVNIFCSLTVENHDDPSILENKERCAACVKKNKKVCCSEFPCEVSPCDLIRVDEETIIGLLKTGLVVIDKWSGDYNTGLFDQYNQIYILRMRAIGEEGILIPIFSGHCASLCDTGCLIPFNHRPYLARSMVNCGEYITEDMKKFALENSTQLISSKEQCVIMWRPYQDIMCRIVEKLKPDNPQYDIVSLRNSLRVQHISDKDYISEKDDIHYLELYNKSLMKLE